MTFCCTIIREKRMTEKLISAFLIDRLLLCATVVQIKFFLQSYNLSIANQSSGIHAWVHLLDAGTTVCANCNSVSMFSNRSVVALIFRFRFSHCYRKNTLIT